MERWKCFICGGECIWQNDFDAEECGYEAEGVVHFYVCSKCGAEHEVREIFTDNEETESEVDDRQITWGDLLHGKE